MRRGNSLVWLYCRLPLGDAHLAGFIDEKDEQADVDAQQLHVAELDHDVAHDDHALAQPPRGPRASLAIGWTELLPVHAP
jgi:hypothetical protein